jgi:hypothetical protein
MRRTTCGSCGSANLEIFLDLGTSPVADAYTSTIDEISVKYPLELAVCEKCKLVQLLEVLDDVTLFGTGYSFYSSASPPLSAYHEKYAASILKMYPNLARRLTVEIGCNDGDMLQHFRDSGCDVLGIDPASGPVGVARGRGLDIKNQPFTDMLAASVAGVYEPGIVVANHVLAHVSDVNDFLTGMARIMTSDTIAFIEVQYLPDLLVNNAFDLVYHEHRNFFSLTALELAARQVDLHVFDARLTDRQGGSLRVQLSKKVLDHTANFIALKSHERWLSDMSTYAGFQGRVDRIRERLLMTVDRRTERDQTVIGYGAPAKATTLLNFCGFTARDIAYVVDSTPAKQGRFIPGTGIPIVSNIERGMFPDAVLILAWNYAKEIIRKHPGLTAVGTEWIIPIPAPVVL